jgi:hypothetical protein
MKAESTQALSITTIITIIETITTIITIIETTITTITNILIRKIDLISNVITVRKQDTLKNNVGRYTPVRYVEKSVTLATDAVSEIWMMKKFIHHFHQTRSSKGLTKR